MPTILEPLSTGCWIALSVGDEGRGLRRRVQRREAKEVCLPARGVTYRTLQDRLVKELRVAGIRTVAAAIATCARASSPRQRGVRTAARGFHVGVRPRGPRR